MLGICRDGGQGLSGHLKQQAIKHRLVVIGNGADGCGQGEDHVVIVHWQQFSLTRLKPTLGRTGLALGAMTVATGVIGNSVVSAAITVQHVSPSAALRHCSMADMTLSWPRLKCPCWVCRQAGPWVRKMSATSKARWPTAVIPMSV